MCFRDTDILKLRDHSGYEKESTNRINAIHDDEEEDKYVPNPLEVRFLLLYCNCYGYDNVVY